MNAQRTEGFEFVKNYRAFDLSISSDLEFPELVSAGGEGTAEVVIARSPEPQEPIESARIDHNPVDGLTLAIPRVARLRVRAGQSIEYRPDPDHNLDLLRVYLLGAGLGTLLMQRGFLTLHANAVKVADRLVLCAGRSGVGKSTLAAKFHQRGYDVYSDDLTAIDAMGYAAMGIRRIKLWPETVAGLGLKHADFSEIAPELPKLQMFPDLGKPLGRLPVRHVYCLDTHEERSVVIDECHGTDRFPAIRSVLYRKRMLNTLGLEASNLALLVNFARGTRVKRIFRHPSDTAPDAVVDAILADLQR